MAEFCGESMQTPPGMAWVACQREPAHGGNHWAQDANGATYIWFSMMVDTGALVAEVRRLWALLGMEYPNPVLAGEASGLASEPRHPDDPFGDSISVVQSIPEHHWVCTGAVMESRPERCPCWCHRATPPPPAQASPEITS